MPVESVTARESATRSAAAVPHDVAAAALDSLASVSGRELVPTRRAVLRRAVSALWPPLLSALVLVAAWQVLYASAIWPDWKFPGPAQVWTVLSSDLHNGRLVRSLVHTLHHAAAGFGASVVVGTPLGLLVGRIRAIRAAVGPLLAGLQSLPSVAWVLPALMFLGPDPAMLYAVVLLAAVPSVAVGVVSGLDQVPPLYLRVGRNLGARGLANVRHVLLPAALPGYLAGLRQGWAFAWRSLLAAEIIVQSAGLGPSLGLLLKDAQDANDQAGAIAAIAVIFAVGVLVNQVVFGPLERAVLRNRGMGLGNGAR